MRRTVLAVVLLLAPALAQAQTQPQTFISGYAKDVRGEVVRHEAPQPDAASALIAHAADAAHSTIEWDSAPVPENARGPLALALLWNVSAGGGGRWSVYAGDTKIATLDSATDTGPRDWEVASEQVPGLKLEVHLFSLDRHSDPGGHLYLWLPSSHYTPGQPVRVRIVGESAGTGAAAAKSDPWLMVFRYDATPRTTVRAEPALVRQAGPGAWQQLRIDVTHYGSDAQIEANYRPPNDPSIVQYPVNGGVVATLKRGFSTFRLNIPAVKVETTMAVTVDVDRQALFAADVPVAPVKPVSLYLLHHSHLDIGYTHVQRDVAAMQAKNLQQALDLIDKTRDYPADARFKWNVEGFWSAEAFLAQAAPEQRVRLQKAMQAGQIEIGPLYGNMLTGLAQPQELTRMTDEARRFAREAGVSLKSAWISDVPGYSWGVVPALAQSGIKYFSLGTNTGDRIGHIIERLGDRPFYWRSASGQEKLLCWLHASGYSYFHTGLSYTNRANLLTEEKLFGYVRQVQTPDRPYDLLPLRYNIGSDNGPPDDRLSDLVRAWNEKYVSPHLVVSTMTEFFSAFEQRYGASLPTYAGELTPYWEDGAYSTARESIATQAASARLEQAETFWALRGARAGAFPAEFPTGRFREAWRNVLLFNEHTWGSWNSISAPESPFTKAQWETKRTFAVEADRQSKELLDAALGAVAAEARATADNSAPEPMAMTSIDVFNSLSWPRTDLVTVPVGYAPVGERVIDAQGRPVRSQRLSSGQLVFLASNVPALGARRYRFVVAPETASADADASTVVVADAQTATVTANEFSVTLDPSTGAIRTITGVPIAGAGVNQYLYQAGRQPGAEQTPSNVRVSVGERGPLVASLVAESTAPGTNQLRQEVRLVAGLRRVEIVDTIDKRNIYDPEAAYFAFPFDIAEPQTRLGVVHGFYRPEAQQLPGSCKNYFTVRNWLDVSTTDRGITLISPDALLVELGRVTTDANRVGWLEQTSDSSIVYSYAMNNFWGTNYKAGQEGPTTYRYRLVPHARFDAAAAYKAGLEATHPLVPRPVASPTTRKTAAPLRAPFILRSRNVIVSSLTPSDDGRGVIVTLFNAGERPERPVLIWRKPARLKSRPSTIPRLPAFGVLKISLAR